MRDIILDTETTGLYPAQGHRIVEIGAVEVANRQMTGRTWHVYLNPDREVEASALEVHGLSNEFLADKPRFPDVHGEFLDFIAGARLVIHNAPFDVGFLNAELARLDMEPVTSHCADVLDTLKLAKELHPGQKNNLDALCRRYGVDNSGRSYHGALLDAQLLAEVFLAMTRGQDSLAIESVAAGTAVAARRGRPEHLRVIRAEGPELAEHQAYLASLRKESGDLREW